MKWKAQKGGYRYSLLISSLLDHSLVTIAHLYDERAAIEAESKADKGGLQSHHRRKKQLAAQEALVLLTDLAHNLLAWTPQWMFQDSPFAEGGIYRIIKERLPIPGKVMMKEGESVTLRLKESHPLAKPMLACLTRLFDSF